MKDRLLIVGTAIWSTVFVLLLIFFHDLAGALWIGIYGVELAVILFAVGLLVVAAVRMRRSRRVSGVCALVVVGALVFSYSGGDVWGERVRFAFVRSSYEKRLKPILESFDRGIPVESHFPDYIIEPGPPVQVAFLWQAGVADNWIGLVYDPTDIVMKANQLKRDQSNWNDPALEPVKRLFYGDLFQTHHLKDHWYLCYFT